MHKIGLLHSRMEIMAFCYGCILQIATFLKLPNEVRISYIKKTLEKEEKREDIIFKAAHIFNQFLEAGHPFVDGNKQTGFVILWLFLKNFGMMICNIVIKKSMVFFF